MKPRFLLLTLALLFRGCIGMTPVCPAAEPPTLTHAQVLSEIEQMGAQAKLEDADDASAHQELADEHAAHLQAEAAAADARAQVRDLGDKLAYLQAKYAAAVKTIWWYRIRFWGPITLALAVGAVMLVTRFTSWGARTLGPYVVKAAALA